MDITNVLQGFELPIDHPPWERALLLKLADQPSEPKPEAAVTSPDDRSETFGMVLPFRRSGQPSQACSSRRRPRASR
jgi:hypothetical protein